MQVTQQEQNTADTHASSKSFGELLRYFRERLHLSQIALARLTGRSSSYVSLLESGTRLPTVGIVQEFSENLRLTPEEKDQLLEAGGFVAQAVSGATQRMIDSFRVQNALGDTETAIFAAELHALLTGWQGFFAASQAMEQGRFSSAKAVLTQLADHQTYSWALQSAIQGGLSQALVQTGPMYEAEEAARRARRLMPNVDDPDETTLEMVLLNAENLANQGIIALRTGNFSLALALMNQSKKTYERLLTYSNVDQLVQFGLAKSYKRLAQVALFQGKPTEGLLNCVNAEAYLKNVTPSPSKNLWQRRTQDLLAWAYSEMHDFPRAIALRKKTLADCAAAEDTYGQYKNALYLGDDYRRQIESLLNRAEVHVIFDAAERRQAICAALTSEPECAGWLDQASQYYDDALTGLCSMTEKVMHGRALRGRALIMRYRAASEPNVAKAEKLYQSAHDNLISALEIERQLGQDSRLPSLYAALAGLEWDRGDYVLAISYYAAIVLPNDPAPYRAADNANGQFQKDVHAALTILHRHVPGSQAPELSPREQRWRELCDHIVGSIATSIETLGKNPVAQSNTASSWIERILEVEAIAKPRLLAQNKFSTALALGVPAGYTPDGAALHASRFYLVQNHIISSEITPGLPNDPHRDLCCWKVVERGAQNEETRQLVLDQAQQAQKYLQRHPSGYMLEAGEYQLPLAFMIKDDHVLIEVPGRLAERFIGVITEDQAEQLTLCYAIESAKLAEKLREYFRQLEDLARESMRGHHPQHSTQDWLNALVKRTSTQPSNQSQM